MKTVLKNMRKQSRRLMGLIVCSLWWAMQSPAQAQPPDPPQEPHAPIERVTLEEAHELVGGPTLVTLNFDNAMPQAVYEELFRQAEIKPHLSGDNFWTRHTKPLTVHFERKPFWVVVRELESQSGLTLYFVHGNRYYALGTIEEAKAVASSQRGPWQMSDSFLVTAGAITWSQRRVLSLADHPFGDDPEQGTTNDDGALRMLSLYVLPDPKFGWPRAADVEIETAVDEKGNSLLSKRAVADFDPLGAFPAAVQFNLYRPDGKSRARVGADASRKIARLKGKIRLVFVSAVETWEVSDPLNSPPLTKELFLPEGREEYSITKPEAERYGVRMTYSIKRQQSERPPDSWIRSKRKSQRPLRSDVLFPMVADSLSLIDADGTVHSATPGGGGGSIFDWKYNVSFYYPNGVKDQLPAKLIWKIPREWKEVEVPFEFTDLPLP